jgi:5'-nucleotidase
MRILVDMDGVIADFEAAFLDDWRKHHPDKSFVPVEERNTFQITDQYPAEFGEFIRQIYGAPRFYRQLSPVEGSLAALGEMKKLGLEVFICSSPLSDYQNCVLEKFEWVEEHLGSEWVKRLILTKDKTIVRADILIDDKPVITGSDTPTWEHVIYDQPYNRTQTRQRRLTWQNWKSILLG